MKNNILFTNKISWFDIDEKGYIKGYISNKPAIYIYKECNEGSCYVGSSILLANRLSSHRFSVINSNKTNNKGSPLLYNSILNLGWVSFKFGVLEYLDLSTTDKAKIKQILLEREQYYLNCIKPSLNLCQRAGSPLGIKHGLLFGRNVSEAKRGKK